MQKCICIPMEQYELMLDIYDKVVEELKVMKKALDEALELTVDTTEPQTMNEAMLMYANKNKANMFIGF